MGGRHIQWLVQNRLLLEAPSESLDKVYGKDAQSIIESDSGKEKMLITQKQVQDISDTLDIPALGIELERAIWQVENAIKEKEAQEGKAKDATTKSQEASKDEKKDQ